MILSILSVSLHMHHEVKLLQNHTECASLGRDNAILNSKIFPLCQMLTLLSSGHNKRPRKFVEIALTSEVSILKVLKIIFCIIP